MVYSITQETFDNAVKENMEEFDMAVDEAITDTVKEYVAQGVDLSNIVVDLMASNIDPTAVTTAATHLAEHVKHKKTANEYIPELMAIRRECDKGIQYRIIAGKHGAYDTIIDLILLQQEDNEILCESFKTLTSLMTKQPDLLNPKGVGIIISMLKSKSNEDLLKLVLKWTRECCILHENNRQHIFDAGILDHLKRLLTNASSSLLCSVLTVLKALVLDDDIRVEFGRAHEHARAIASDTLCAISGLLETFKTDEAVMNELLSTLSALLVRTEFCKKVEAAGGLHIIQTALVQFFENDKLTRQCLKVLKALAGNDECKTHIITNGAAPLIVNSVNKHSDSAQTAIVGLACIAALTLRSMDNSKALYESGAPKVIVAILEKHPDNEAIQKTGSWAIRNMVSRSRYQTKEFVKLGIEPLLHNALKKFKNIEYDVKAALRDLDCTVDLKEEWTGKGGMITTEAKGTQK